MFMLSDVKLVNRHELKLQAQKRGFFYVVPQDKQHLYDLGTTVPYNSLLHGNNTNPILDTVECGGVIPLHRKTFVMVQKALGEFNKFTLAITPLYRKLLRNPQESLAQRLELREYNPNLQYITNATIMRADLVMLPDGRLVSCDNNYMPLGIADVVAYQPLLGIEPTMTPYFKVLGKLTRNGIGGIVTEIDYPSWASHEVVANAVRETTGNPFVVIPNYALLPSGMVDAKKLQGFYDALSQNHDISMPHLPIRDFIPETIVRYGRQTQRFHQETTIINQYGMYMHENHVLTAMMWIPGMANVLDELEIDVDLELMKAGHAPSAVVQVFPNAMGIATSVKLVNNELEFSFVDIGDAEVFLAGLTAQAQTDFKTNWFMKKATSTGKKGVEFTAKKPLNRVKDMCLGLVNGQFGPGELATLQPRISSYVQIGEEVLTGKFEIFALGPNARNVGTTLMTDSKAKLAIHGGSEVVTWMVTT